MQYYSVIKYYADDFAIIKGQVCSCFFFAKNNEAASQLKS